MRKILRRGVGLLSFALMISQAAFGQAYVITPSATDAGNPGGIRTSGDYTTTGGTSIWSGAQAVQSWSAVQTLPFSFDFYGTPVTKYIVASNGLLSFDTTYAGTAVNTALDSNTTLPNSNLPDKTVAYFWEDFTGVTSTGDKVYAMVEGTAPNRQLWILNYSMKVGNLSYAYWALVLEETTNKIYAVDMNYWYLGSLSSTVGVQINSTTAYQSTNSPNVIFNNGGSSNTDNEYFTFDYYAPGAIIPPVNVGVTNIQANSAVATYDLGTSTAGEIEYGLAGFTQGAGTTVTCSGSSHTLTSLTDASNYEFYIRSSSGGSYSNWVGPIAFTTPCLTASMPYSQNFDTWPLICEDPNAGTKSWTQYGGDWAEANFWSNNNADFIMDMQNVAITVPAQLTFVWSHLANTSYPEDDLAILAKIQGATTWDTIWYGVTSAGTFNSNDGAASTTPGTGVPELITLPATYVGQTVQFQMNAHSDYGPRVWVDDFVVEAVPSCPLPQNFTSFNVTPTSMDVAFTSTGGANNVEWGLTGYAQGTGTLVSAANDTISLTALPPGTCLDIYVQSDCSGTGNGTSLWVGPYTICTPCLAASMPYIQNFNSWPLVCEDPAVGSKVWEVYNNEWARARYYSNNNYDYIMDMQIVDITAAARLSFTWSHKASTSYPDDDLAILARPLDSLSWDTIWYAKSGDGNFESNDGASYTSVGTGVTEILLLPAHYVGQEVAFQINGHSDWGPDCFVDNFIVEEVPSCLEPLGITLVYVNDTSAALTWTADSSAASSNVEWGPVGFTLGTGTVYTGTGDSIYLTGLPPASMIEVYISVNCSPTTTSIVTGPFTFRTACPSYFSAPYSENFSLSSYGVADASLSFENCWSTNFNTYVLRWESEDASGANENSLYTGPFYDHTDFGNAGGGYMFIEASYTGADAELYSPMIEMSALTTPTLKFWYFMYGSTTGTLWAEVDNGNGNWITVWSLSGEQQTAGSDPWLQAEVPLAAFVGDTVQVRFRAQRGSNYYSDISIDDVSIENGSSCSVVAGGFADNVTATAADLNWSAFTSSNYNVEWGPCGFTPATGVGTVVSNVTPGTTVTGLSPNTCYEFYVTNNCDPSATLYGPYSFTTECLAQLSGTYTIGGTPGAMNFADLDTAMAALVCGISGPVTYQIVGQQVVSSTVVVGNIDGLSNTNTFTFDGLGTGEIKISGIGPVISLENTKHINITNLTITDSSASGYGIRLYQDADSINITNNTIVAGPTATSSASAGIAITNSLTSTTSTGSGCEYINISNNTIIGGYYGITASGIGSTTPVNGLTISGNTVTDAYYYGIRTYYYSNVELTNNNVDNFRNTYNYGFYLYYNNDITVEKNYARSSGTYTVYAPGLNNGYAAGYADFVNNMFINTAASNYCMYITSSSQNVNMYHNTIVGGGYGVYNFSTVNMDYRNNIFVGGTYPFYSNSALTSTDVVDYNLYFARTGGNIAYAGVAQANLAAWQTADTAHNQNSLSGDPIFVDITSDVHVVGALANDVGDNSVGVVVDFDGDVRPASGATVVDMGADEYTPLLWDAQMNAIFEPASNGCGDSAVVVSVIVSNLGLNDITSLSVNADVSGDVTANLSTTYTTTIASSASDTIVVGTFNIYTGGTVNVDAYVTLTNDGDLSNDTASTVTRSFVSYEPLVLQGDTVCEGSNIDLYAVPQTGVIYGWYENQNDSVPVATGDTLSVTADTAQTTYWVGYTTSGSDSLTTAFAGGNSCSGGNMFDVTTSKSLMIEGFAVSTMVATGSPMPYEVYYGPSTYLGNELTPGAWTLHESGTVTSMGIGNPTKFTFTAPLMLNPGTTAIYVSFSASYTNGTQTVSNGDLSLSLGSGLCGLFSGNNPGRVFNGIIYYRAGNSCSPNKVPVNYTVNMLPTAGVSHNWVNGNGTGLVTFDATSSTDAVDYSWDFGDGNTATGDTASNVYATNGTYYVTLAVSNTCGTDTIMDTVVIEGIGLNELSGVQNISVFPNPASSNVNLSIELAKAQDLMLEVINLQGQVLYSESLGRVEGEYIWSSDVSSLPRGAYFIRLTGETGVKTLPLSLN